MENPSANSLLETVRKINEIGRRARSGEPSVEDYLRALASDPVTKWFTDLLREKSTELEAQRQRADRLTGAVKTWHWKSRERISDGSASEAEIELANVLRVIGVVEHE
jgi:hypothetical protein